jgi:hypothetical protein
MKNLLHFILLALIIPLQAQEFKNGQFVKVIQAEGKSIDDIRASVREWVSENYGSAESVIDLDSETKMIVKGQINLPQTSGKYRVDAKFKTTLTVSYKESKFKVDLKFNSFFNPVTNSWDNLMLTQYKDIIGKTLSKDEYFEVSRKAFREQKIEKMGEKMLKKKGDSMYADYLTSKKESNEVIEKIYTSIETKVNSTSNNDDW